MNDFSFLLRPLLYSLVALGTLLTGCMAPSGFAPAPYLPPPKLADVYGTVRPVGTRTVQLLPVRDSLHPESRARLAPGFSVTAYFTDALKREMTGLGITFVLVTPGTNAVATTPEAVPADACRLEAEARWLSENRAVVDVKLTTTAGQLLLEKRAYTSLNSDIRTITHMVLRQILADPAFREAIR